MNYKFGFTFLVISVIVAGITPFAISQSNNVEPSMEIDMLAGQTQNPFRIQDQNDVNVFAITPSGSITPRPVVSTTYVLSNSIYDEWFPTYASVSPATTCPNAESGTGVYQYSYTVTELDVDESVDSYGAFTRDEYIPNINYQMRNTAGTSIGVGWKLFINDNLIAGRTNGAVTANNYIIGQTQDREEFNGAVNSTAYLKAGDVIGWKCYQTSGTADSLQLNHLWLQGFPVLTTDALNVSITFIDFGLHTVNLSPTIPSNLAGVTMTSWGDCLTVASNDWGQCFGQNSFSGDFQIGVGGVLMYGTQGDTITQTASNEIYVTDDQHLNVGEEITVTTWR